MSGRYKLPPEKAAPAAQLDEWVKGAEQTPAPAAPPAPSPTGGKLARLTIDLPPELHARFKATCALKGTRMIDQVRGFIEDWTQKNG